MKTILVTGGAGFIGSNFVHYMLDKHPQLRIVDLDALTYAGNLENLADLKDEPRHIFVRGDIGDRTLVGDLFRQYDFDAVVNFAAESHVDRSITQPELFLTTNVLGTQTLLDAARRCWSAAPDDKYCRDYREGVKFLQVSNNYGPYQFPEKLIPLMLHNAANDKALPVYGDGMQVRDWLYVEDHCSAIDTVLEKGIVGEVYNVGGNNEKANIEIVKLILSRMGKDESLITHVKDRPGHDRRYAIDNTKITTQLGWEPAYSFEAGMAKTIDWYLSHEEWMRGVTSGAYLTYYEKMYS